MLSFGGVLRFFSSGFVPHGQLFEAAAVDDGVALVAQGLEVDVVRDADELAGVASPGRPCSWSWPMCGRSIRLLFLRVAFKINNFDQTGIVIPKLNFELSSGDTLGFLLD